MCAAGDYNSNSLRHLLQPDCEFREETWSRRAYLHTDLERAERRHEVLEHLDLVVLTPPGGLPTTFRPYQGGPERVLGYIFVSRSLSSALWTCDALEVALPTDHKPLTALLRATPIRGLGRPQRKVGTDEGNGEIGARAPRGNLLRYLPEEGGPLSSTQRPT